MQNIINPSDKQYRELKREYYKATRDKKDIFILWDQEVLTKFAQYWIQEVENDRVKRGMPNAVYNAQYYLKIK